MGEAVDELWTLVQDRQQIDPAALWHALESTARSVTPLDYRSRLLVHDSLSALSFQEGRSAVETTLTRFDSQGLLYAAWNEQFERSGFESLKRRIMETTKPETVLQFLRDLGLAIRSDARIVVGGSTALILTGVLVRQTEDMDVVNEVPAVVRSEHDLLQSMADRYGLSLTHFQSHYLPTGWETRVRTLGQFGRLHVSLVDAIDIFVGKLFSVREKDRDDLRALAPKLDRYVIEQRVHGSTSAFRSEAKLLEAARTNWYVVYGDVLPTINT